VKQITNKIAICVMAVSGFQLISVVVEMYDTYSVLGFTGYLSDTGLRLWAGMLIASATWLLINKSSNQTKSSD
jgi:hypothetical protein